MGEVGEETFERGDMGETWEGGRDMGGGEGPGGGGGGGGGGIGMGEGDMGVRRHGRGNTWEGECMGEGKRGDTCETWP